eukprot:1904389-Pleurochrysis_carterae.AAC.3
MLLAAPHKKDRRRGAATRLHGDRAVTRSFRRRSACARYCRQLESVAAIALTRPVPSGTLLSVA